MKVRSFFTFLNKYKYILIIVPLVTLIAAYFILESLPDKYVSSAQIATGIIDASRSVSDKDNTHAQVEREFSNLISIAKLKKVIDQVSYQLIVHDLSDTAHFRDISQHFKISDTAAVHHILSIYNNKIKNGATLSSGNKEEKALIDLLISMGYDDRSLKQGLDISRESESDYITISFTSENPKLSAFVVNALSKDFIAYYSVFVKKSQLNTADYLTNLLVEKKDTLDKKQREYQDYKIRNGVVNPDEQAKSFYEQIATYNDKKNQAIRDIASYDGAIKNIDERFNPKDRKYIEATLSQYNQAITSTEAQLRALNEEYVRAGFNPKYKPALDSLQKQLASQINSSSDKYITNPLVAKDDLVKQKMNLEVSRDLAKYSVEAIDHALTDLEAQKTQLSKVDAVVKTYELDISLAQQAYLEILNKYNQSNLQSNFAINLVQVDTATPDEAIPSNKLQILIICGVTSLLLCLLIAFIHNLYDNKIKEPADLIDRTHLPVLGTLNKIDNPSEDLTTLWDVEQRHKMKQFKELLRSVRFEIDQELKDEKVVAITSLGEGEGKTLLATSLAYAYAAINRKVLLIDGNFDHPSVSNSMQPKAYVEDHFRSSSYIERENNEIVVLGNRGEDITLLEINDEKHILNDLNDFRLRYDIILIDLPPLDSLNKSKEWVLFANKLIAVFEVNHSISRSQNQVINYLKNLKGKFSGWILNKV
jgi:uncharacterized protein involved in exopolysaccharide biosynthesis/Mrp family chromosome partitioning ATPase